MTNDGLRSPLSLASVTMLLGQTPVVLAITTPPQQCHMTASALVKRWLLQLRVYQRLNPQYLWILFQAYPTIVQ